MAIFFPPSQQPSFASTPTSSHQTTSFQPNLPDVQITQYGEARRFNHQDSAKAAMPDTLAYEGSEMSAEVNRQKKRRKRKKCGARKCEAPPDESQASPEDESAI